MRRFVQATALFLFLLMTTFTSTPSIAVMGDYLGMMGAGTLEAPNCLVVGLDGNLYVTDTNHHQIVVFTPTGNQVGQPLAPYQVFYPRDIATAPDGNFYVTSTYNDRIMQMAPAGDILGVFGGYGSTTGMFNQPAGVVVDAAGSVYVADTGNNRVQVFDSVGNFLRSWGVGGDLLGQLITPMGIAIAGDKLFVADTGNSHIEVFDKNTGGYLDPIGVNGHTGMFESPLGMMVSPDGTLYVADSLSHHVDVLATTWPYTHLGTIGALGIGAGQFMSPTGIAIGPDGTLYVADSGNNRIQAFEGYRWLKAEAGADQTATMSTEPAMVNLSAASTKVNGGLEPTYTWSWSWGEDDYTATGPNPTVNLPRGVHTIRLLAEANGLSSTDTMQVTVLNANFSGFMPPLDKPYILAGGPVKVAFKLTDHTGMPMTMFQPAVFLMQDGNVRPAESMADGSNVCRYNPKTQLYELRFNTKGLPNGAWVVIVDMGDGRDMTTTFTLR